MYLPEHFKQDDLNTLHDAMESAGLAIVTTNGPHGPEASHVPLLLDREKGTLTGHLARANSHWRALEAAATALVIFPGPDAYVSPSWYPSKQEAGKAVPTWNYVAVHASGPVTVFHEPERLRDAVERLTEKHESGRADPWAVDDAPPDYVKAMLGAIVGFEIAIERLEGKWKLSQNRSEADRNGVIEGLRQDGLIGMADRIAAQASSESSK
jgi:transcriptional regulator